VEVPRVVGANPTKFMQILSPFMGVVAKRFENFLTF